MPNETLTNITLRHFIYLERIKTGEFNKYEPFLKRIAKDIRVKLSGNEITDYTRARLNKLVTSVGRDIKIVQGEFNDKYLKSSLELAQYEADFEAKSLNQVLKHDFVIPSETQLKSAVLTNPMAAEGFKGKLLEPFTKTMTASAILNISDNVRSGAFGGLTNAEIVKNIIGTKSQKYTNGELRKLQAATEKMVRTGLAHVSSQARKETWKNNSDVVTGFKIVVTFDSRTSPLCINYGSTPTKVYNYDTDPMNPFHINCRSTTVGALDEKYAMLSKGGTRAARDANGKHISVDRNQTYYGWLKSQDNADFQDSVIGKTRGKLLRDGGLTEKRFAALQMNRKFEPLTIKAARKLDPLAFERAGLIKKE